jgi:uncharacterized protein (DUF58 family)
MSSVDDSRPSGSATQPGGLAASPRFQRWLDRRVPPAKAIVLNQKNIFILPTREGFYALLLIVLMMLAGINYQNSLIFGLAFLLASFFMVSILHTYRNLSGLTIKSGGARASFAGEDAEFRVTMTRHGKRHYEALLLGWQKDWLQQADLIEDEEVSVRLYVPTVSRGLFNPGRMLLETYYPVGLFRAWSWIALDTECLVYPRPIPAGAVPDSIATDGDGDLLRREGVDDFHGFRDFIPGDSLRHVAWKTFARTAQLHTKEFAAFVDRRVWLDWESMQGLDGEDRLSRLCYWVLQLSAGNDEYGLRLPGVEIAPGRGDEHRDSLLKTLALFER